MTSDFVHKLLVRGNLHNKKMYILLTELLRFSLQFTAIITLYRFYIPHIRISRFMKCVTLMPKQNNHAAQVSYKPYAELYWPCNFRYFTLS